VNTYPEVKRSKLKKFLALEASAGSGKTFYLAIRYISIMLSNVNPATILCLTFTNKAASEMKDRISSILSSLEVDSPEFNEIIRQTDFDEEYILNWLPIIKDRFNNSELQIMTIDAFVNKILRSFAMHININPNFDIAKSSISKELNKFLSDRYKKSESLNSLVNVALHEEMSISDVFDVLKGLYEKDNELHAIYERYYDVNIEDTSEAIFHLENEILEIVSNLKEDINNRNISLNSRQVNGLNIKKVSELYAKTWITHNSFDIPRGTYKKIYFKEMDIYLQELRSKLNLLFRAKEGYFVKSILDLYLSFKDSLIELKKSNNRLYFDDISNLTYSLLRGDDITNEFLYFRIDSKINHILIDEFQDTSILQWKILEPIVEEIVSGKKDDEDRTFFYVGDIKQSIYRFRGGNYLLFHYVKDKFDIHLDTLEYNYRSDKNIIHFVNTVFKDKYENFIEQKVGPHANEGKVQVMYSPKDEELTTSILKQVVSLREHGVKYKDMTVLVNTNDESLILKDIFETNLNINVITESNSLLINQPDVKAVIEFIKYINSLDVIHLYNFNGILNRDLKQEVNVPYFSEFKENIPMLINEIIKTFKLFTGNSTLIKLIEEARKYSDIENFVENIDESNASSSNNMIFDSLNIMTIHKSKGLEFKHLIISDAIKKIPNFKNKFFFNYDNIMNPHIFYYIKNREVLDIDYCDGYNKENKIESYDTMNRLYVAMTRAKKSLSIIVNDTSSMFKELQLAENDFGKFDIEKEESVQLITKIELSEVNYGEVIRTPKNISITKEVMFNYIIDNIYDINNNMMSSVYDILKYKYGAMNDNKVIFSFKEEVRTIFNTISNMKSNDSIVNIKDNFLIDDSIIEAPISIINKDEKDFYTHIVLFPIFSEPTGKLLDDCFKLKEKLQKRYSSTSDVIILKIDNMGKIHFIEPVKSIPIFE
jgi:exodeoxyribonuclease V beta subunit